MSVNGVTGYSAASQTYAAQATTDNKKTDSSNTAAAASKTAAENSGVVYEPSADAAAAAKTKKYTKADPETIARLQSDTENRAKQLVDLVHKILNGQANTAGKAEGSIWDVLRSGEFTVDAATKEQAQADVAEDGYWGVSQTSTRILDFATALTGGDPDKIEEMRDAFEKGFKMAEKTWGGKLPAISQQTYDAVMSGFDKMKDGTATA